MKLRRDLLTGLFASQPAQASLSDPRFQELLGQAERYAEQVAGFHAQAPGFPADAADHFMRCASSPLKVLRASTSGQPTLLGLLRSIADLLEEHAGGQGESSELPAGIEKASHARATSVVLGKLLSLLAAEFPSARDDLHGVVETLTAVDPFRGKHFYALQQSVEGRRRLARGTDEAVMKMKAAAEACLGLAFQLPRNARITPAEGFARLKSLGYIVQVIKIRKGSTTRKAVLTSARAALAAVERGEVVEVVAKGNGIHSLFIEREVLQETLTYLARASHPRAVDSVLAWGTYELSARESLRDRLEKILATKRGQ